MYMEEIWKSIKGYEKRYEISNLGRVRSRMDNKGKMRLKILKISSNYNGYSMVNLKSKHITKRISVHRLVAIAFIPNPHSYPQVNHINEDKTDNRSCNLEWCSASYNCNYGNRNYRMRMNLTKTQLKRAIKVCQINKENNEVINVFPSLREAYRKTGVRESGISNCLKGRCKSCGGFYWKQIA